jgi:SPP1 gp7 family putative phage head morphogenesis protein
VTAAPPEAATALLWFARRLLCTPDPDDLMRRLLGQEPLLARLLRDGLLHAYLTSARRRPGRSWPAPPAGMARPRTARRFSAPDEPPPPVRFPGTEAAADWLARRRLMLPEDFARLSAEAKSAAFTVARAATLDAVEKVRDASLDAFVNGGTLAEFRGRVREAVGESKLSEGQVEQMFRTNVGNATAAGQRAVLEHPLIADEFPYRLWSATHDERTRPTHRAMETHGQNGTAVYRSDDPMWDVLWPPCEWNCRCVCIPLSLEDAAREGSREAQKWLLTGAPPDAPEFARVPYPIQPPEGWPSHRGVSAVV